MKNEVKSMALELKDVDTTSRTATIAHAHYDNVDRTNDILRKGAFTKSWAESKSDIAFYFNHNDEQSPGVVLDVSDDNQKAYTHVKCGTHTLGNDVLIMMDEGVAKAASFGYATIKSNPLQVKGKKVRELKEIYHVETSILTKMPANPLAGLVQVNKSFDLTQTSEFKMLNDIEQSWLRSMIANGLKTLGEMVAFSATLDTDSDLYTSISYMISNYSGMIADMKSNLRWGLKSVDVKSHLETMENFCRNTKASDEAIKGVLEEINSIKEVLADDTADTLLITEPSASKSADLGFKDLITALKN